MNKISLDDQYSFCIQKEEKRLRMILYSGNEEWVCHKVDEFEIRKFIESGNNHLFKGRLQLDKKGNHIIIYVKGNIVGTIGLSEFGELIKKATPIASRQS